MFKYVLASLILLSTIIIPANANAQGFFNNGYYGRGTFIDRLVGNGGYGGYGYGYRPWGNGYYPGNSYWGHHHHHHCGGGYYAYRGWGRRWH
ncbi:MAG TPA: hypothetical protein V6D22_14730 [Candidatus Obscuribacterales bacterium]